MPGHANEHSKKKKPQTNPCQTPNPNPRRLRFLKYLKYSVLALADLKQALVHARAQDEVWNGASALLLRMGRAGTPAWAGCGTERGSGWRAGLSCSSTALKPLNQRFTAPGKACRASHECQAPPAPGAGQGRQRSVLAGARWQLSPPATATHRGDSAASAPLP